MRIAIFTDTFYPQINGVSNTLRNLSQYLQANQVEHVFFAPDYDFESPECAGLPVIRFKGICPKIYPECRIAFVSTGRMAGLLEEFAPDVVHIVSELGIGFAGLRASGALGIPVVMSYHTNFDRYLQFYNLPHFKKMLWAYMKWFHSFALVNLCPSGDTLRTLRQQGLQNLDIWSRGIDLERFNPSCRSKELRTQLGAGDKTVFLYVGRVSVEKGLDVLMQSICALNDTHGGEIQFWITGDGPFLPEMRKADLPNVVLTGEKRGAELSEIYASADAFVFPSGTETFGNVLLEAMASGLPVICTDSGGITDYTVHNENAWVFANGNADGLTRAILDFLDPKLREHIRKGGLRTAKSKSWEAVFSRLVAHYERAAQVQQPETPGKRNVLYAGLYDKTK